MKKHQLSKDIEKVRKWVARGLQEMLSEGKTISVPHKEGVIEFLPRRVSFNEYTGSVQEVSKIPNYEMPTISELASLLHIAPKTNVAVDGHDAVYDASRRWIWANTGTLWTKDGVYVQDKPNIDFKNKKILMNEQELKQNLGSRQDGSVVYSNDGQIRFTPHCFGQGEQHFNENNSLGIALFGREEFVKILEAVKDSRFFYQERGMIGGCTSLEKLPKEATASEIGNLLQGTLYVGTTCNPTGGVGYAYAKKITK